MSRPRLVYLLQRADTAVRREVAARAQGTPLSAAAAGVLFHLRSHPDALVGEVTDALGASPAGMSGLLARMTSAGLVARRKDDDDKRAVRLSLTTAGDAACASAAEATEEITEWLCDGFTTAELAVVERWLAHVGQGDSPTGAARRG